MHTTLFGPIKIMC